METPLTTRPKPPPLDLSHHYSTITNLREPSAIKKYYKYFQIPGLGNLAGGLPNAQFFPFDTLEAQAAKPERWTPSPNEPPSPGALADRLAVSGLSSAPNGVPKSKHADTRKTKATKHKDDEPQNAQHLTVPMSDPQTDPFRKIDVTTALQYGTAEGYAPLLAYIRHFARTNLHPNVPYAKGPEVILTCGSTDGMAKSLELLVTPWDARHDSPRDRPHLLVEKFLYSNVLAQSMPRGVRPVPVEIDAEGMRADGPGGLEEVLSGWNDLDGKRPRIMYTVTMGHNPTSGVLSVERRKAIYALCQKYDVIIVEDDPYWYLQYPSAAAEEAASRGKPVPTPKPTPKPVNSSGYEFLDSLVPSYLSLDVDGRVIRLDTFSKTIAPGCRLGWITAQPEFIERFTSTNLTSTTQNHRNDHPAALGASCKAWSRELLIGSQPDAKSADAALPAAQRPAFADWNTSGWVRWLAGLRGQYERRMCRMARILDEGAHQLKQSTPTRDDLADWGVVTKTRLYDFDWARGGMFLWLRLRFETHPLWQARGRGTADGHALLALGTRRPHLVIPAPGLIFAADERVRAESAWAYLRLCFAAVAEEEIEPCTERFVGTVHKFWRIKSVREIEELLDEFNGYEALGDEGMGNLMGMGMGC
ncbi:aromatic amino acid aminotransferase [Verticillium dahliae VdLs.17]|uniref:Aromatic amino acid aminotransferase n=1 Tax=Verticillium dahliae (strain VdLs.17 / ATCC MYA-4575 / FGSC 10137) TaxID=498257 RepID=G2WU64_VERDV|nr:aromatic amino acid aminotransferase [Verticillium dahliae VdLs.17]EGY17655.1 aromatic amino acid aminotransferase [Verticillium dahliae VdLs.17]